MINKFFKEVQDECGVQNKELVRTVKISPKHLSEFRSGTTNLNTGLLWELIIAMDRISPGAKQAFGLKIASRRIFREKERIDWSELIENASAEDMEQILLAMADRWSQIKSKYADIEIKQSGK